MRRTLIAGSCLAGITLCLMVSALNAQSGSTTPGGVPPKSDPAARPPVDNRPGLPPSGGATRPNSSSLPRRAADTGPAPTEPTTPSAGTRLESGRTITAPGSTTIPPTTTTPGTTIINQGPTTTTTPDAATNRNRINGTNQNRISGTTGTTATNNRDRQVDVFFGPNFVAPYGFSYPNSSTYMYPSWGWSGYGYYGPTYWSGSPYNYRGMYIGAGSYGSGSYGPSSYTTTSSYGPSNGMDSNFSGVAQSFYAGPQSQNMALVRVIVPPQAEVFFGDVPTQSRGMNRWYHSPALEMGKDYTYTITAVWNEGGREMAATKEIDVEAGQESVANFMDRNLWRDARSTPNGHRNGDLRAPDSRYIPPSDRIERERVPNLERDREIDRINETNREELNRNRDRNRDADKPDSTTPKPGDLNRNRSNKTPDPINPKPTDPNRGNDPPKP